MSDVESIVIPEDDSSRLSVPVPAELGVLPLRDTVLFPQAFMPLAVARESSVRLIDVAEAAGVSIATASRALAGNAGVSEALAAKVRGVAAELGYVVNAHARSLAGGRASNRDRHGGDVRGMPPRRRRR